MLRFAIGVVFDDIVVGWIGMFFVFGRCMMHIVKLLLHHVVGIATV